MSSMKIDSDQNGSARDHHRLEMQFAASTSTAVHGENWFWTNTPRRTAHSSDADAQDDTTPRVEAAGDVVGVGNE
jgi:hypothetical protein